MSMAEREKVAHLLRRATFGPTAEEVDEAERAGYQATADRLVNPPTPDGAPGAPVLMNLAKEQQFQRVTDWWLDRMAVTTHQFAEKLVYFWHGHWATSIDKVDSAPLMIQQQNLFRQLGRGDFAPFVKAMLRDPALILWLDGQRNTRRAPNENLARELMELFTIGIGNYTEADVKEGARALTGWTVDRGRGTSRNESGRFDGGDKTILGQTGKFNADSYADLLLAQPATAQFLATRLWFRFAAPDAPSPEVMGRLTAAYGANRDLFALTAAVLKDPAFPATRGQLVKQPTEWAIGAMRQLGVRPSALNEADRKTLRDGLEGMDQLIFWPPSVGGWPDGAAWLTTSSVQVRLRVAELIVARAQAAQVEKINAAPVEGRVDALGRLLVVDMWTNRTREALNDQAKDARKLLALGLISPEYCVH
jgi:uncharacterized protein (DUF1800 family)